MAVVFFEQKPVSPPTPAMFYQSRRPRWQTVEKKPESLIPQTGPNFDDLVTEDDEPVDNIFSEKQQRLLTESLYSGFKGPGRAFLTLANVGLFYAADKSPLVPDVLVSFEVNMPQDVWQKHNRSYFVCEYGKPPEIVIEIVSNLKGKEAGTKLPEYADAKVRYYVIFDPLNQLKKGVLRLYELRGKAFVEKTDRWLDDVGLGLVLWDGRFEDKDDEWLRWCDKNGNLILTGEEIALFERREKELAQQRAEQERREKELAQQHAQRFAAKLRALGINPDEL